MQVPQWARVAGKSVNSNSPTILTVASVAGVITTAVLAVRAVPSANAAILRAKEKIHQARPRSSQDFTSAHDEELTHRETFAAAWKSYTPAGLAGAATIACVIGVNQMGIRRTAAMAGAYSLVDTAFREYKDEVLAQVGVNKERKIHDEIQKHRIDERPVQDSQVIITGGGDQLCYESLTGRYFRSDIEKVRRAENEINRRVLTDMYASVNEFFELLGMDSTVVGDELGWNIDCMVELIFTSHLASDGQPCLAIGYKYIPRKDYGKI